MGLGGVAIAALPSILYPKLSFSDGLGGEGAYFPASRLANCVASRYNWQADDIKTYKKDKNEKGKTYLCKGKRNPQDKYPLNKQ